MTSEQSTEAGECPRCGRRHDDVRCPWRWTLAFGWIFYGTDCQGVDCATEHCEYERDSAFSRCLAPWRFTVARADGDQTYSGGREPGVYRCCEAHLADAAAGMADGDDVALSVTIRYDLEVR